MAAGRNASAALIAALALLPSWTEAQTAADPRRGAYQAAVKCFEVISILVSDAKDEGNQEMASDYDRKARRSFDFALQLGGKLGLSGTHMNEDFGMAQASELPKLVSDKAYFQNSAATCRALGLL